MTMTQAVNAFGTTISMNGVEIAEVTHIGGPSLSRNTIDATHHKSPGMWAEVIKGIKDGGEGSLDLNYIPNDSTHNYATGILSDFADDTTVYTWVITFPDTNNTQFTFNGIVTAFEPDEPFDD